jgi:hypothetical protein
MIDFTAVKNLVSKFTVTGAQKAHIDRLVFELGILEKQVGALGAKVAEKDLTISQQDAKILELSTENEDLQLQLARQEKGTEGLNEEESQILQFFFDAQESSREDAASSLRIPLSRTTHHVGSLLNRNFLRQSKASMGSRHPAKFRITHEGSSHIMKNG